MKTHLSMTSLFVAAFSLFSFLYPSSWVSVNGPYGGTVHSIYFNPNNQAYAEFGGKLWTSADIKNWIPIFQDCRYFWVGGDRNLYVEDTKGDFYFSSDWGSRWQELPKTRTDLVLERMAFSAGRWYFAGGNQVFSSTDGGQTWNAVPFTFDNSAEKIRTDEAGTLYVFGKTKLFKSSDQGITWRQLYASSLEIQDFLAVGAWGFFLAVGSESGGQILKSVDNGTTWVASSLPYAKTLCFSGNWLMGAFGKRGSLFNGASFVSSNGGATWRTVDLGFPILSFSRTTDGKLAAASLDGLWLSADGGVNWMIAGPATADVWYLASGEWGILAVSRTMDGKLRFWITRNDGVSWTEVDKSKSFNDPQTVLGMEFLPDGRLWMLLGYAGGTDRAVLYETKDRGGSWTVKRKSTSETAGFAYEQTSGFVYFWEQGKKVYYYTSDYGSTWVPLSLPFPIIELLISPNGVLYALSGGDVNRPSQLFRSFSSGAAWDPPIGILEAQETVYSFTTNFLGDLFKTVARKNTDGSYNFIKLLRSVDFGDGWQDISPSGLTSWSSPVLPQLIVDQNGGLYLIFAKIFKSSTNGDKWELIYDGQYPAAALSAFPEKAVVYAGLRGGGVVKQRTAGRMFTLRGLAEVEYPISKSYGVFWTDYNGDGYDDIFVLNDGRNELYLNNSGKLKKVTSGEIVTDAEASRAAAWGDYNNDGNPDCYVANSGTGNALYKNNGDGTFKKITLGNVVEDRGNFKSCAWGDVNRDGFLDLYLTRIDGANLLYLNTGTGYFEKSYVNLIGENGDKSYGCAWSDFDNDGDQDLYVCNDGPDQLWEQVSPMKFALVSQDRLARNAGLSAGCSWADVNNDGWMDLFVTNVGSPNRLYLNNGDGSFRPAAGDVSLEAGTFKGSAFGDLDNDGDLDLVVCGNGTFAVFQNQNGVLEKENRFDMPYFGGNSLSLAWGDLENDGKLDLIISSFDRKNVFYSHSGSVGNWIKVKCAGKASNRQAIGAKVYLKAVIDGKSVLQTREISSQSGFLAQNSLIQHFGLGDAQRADSIIVVWPSGKRQSSANIAANQIVTIVESGGVKVAADESRSWTFRILQIYPNPFNSSTSLRFEMDRAGEALVEILDVRGRILRSGIVSAPEEGLYEFEWDGRDDHGNGCPTGIYVIKIVYRKETLCRKVTLLK